MKILTTAILSAFLSVAVSAQGATVSIGGRVHGQTCPTYVFVLMDPTTTGEPEMHITRTNHFGYWTLGDRPWVHSLLLIAPIGKSCGFTPPVFVGPVVDDVFVEMECVE